MSSLTQCNYCTLKGITARAEKKGEKVIQMTDPKGWLVIYTLPKDKDLPTTRTAREKYFRASFMALSDSCCC